MALAHASETLLSAATVPVAALCTSVAEDTMLAAIHQLQAWHSRQLPCSYKYQKNGPYLHQSGSQFSNLQVPPVNACSADPFLRESHTFWQASGKKAC